MPGPTDHQPDPMVIIDVGADATDDEIDAQADDVWRRLISAAGIGDGDE